MCQSCCKSRGEQNNAVLLRTELQDSFSDQALLFILDVCRDQLAYCWGFVHVTQPLIIAAQISRLLSPPNLILLILLYSSSYASKIPCSAIIYSSNSLPCFSTSSTFLFISFPAMSSSSCLNSIPQTSPLALSSRFFAVQDTGPLAECPVSKQVSYQRATNRSLTCRYNLSVLADLLV